MRFDAAVFPDAQVRRAVHAILRRALAEGRMLTLEALTGSMRYLVRPGDRLTVGGAAPTELRRGDVVAVATPFGYRVHRFVGLDGAGWLRTRGDFKAAPDAPTPPDALLGRVLRLHRGAAVVELTGRRAWWRARLVGLLSNVALRAFRLRSVVRDLVRRPLQARARGAGAQARVAGVGPDSAWRDVEAAFRALSSHVCRLLAESTVTYRQWLEACDALDAILAMGRWRVGDDLDRELVPLRRRVGRLRRPFLLRRRAEFWRVFVAASELASSVALCCAPGSGEVGEPLCSREPTPGALSRRIGFRTDGGPAALVARLGAERDAVHPFTSITFVPSAVLTLLAAD
jgi:hypothetical protein